MGANATKVPADKVWAQADADGSGSLNKDEVQVVIQKLWATYQMQKPLSKAFVDGVMGELDPNNDGSVSRQEFDSLYDELWDERATLFKSYLTAPKTEKDTQAYDKELKSIFDRCDTDKSGHLNLDELQKMIKNDSKVASFFGLSTDPKKQQQGIDRLMANVDKDGDKKLTWPEFQKWSQQQQVAAKTGVSSAPKAAPGAGVATAKAGTHPDWLKCPHCAFEINPAQLEKLRVPPEAVALQSGAWDGRPQDSAKAGAVGQAATANYLPPGAESRGTVPLSFLQGPHNLYAAGGKGGGY